MTFVPPATGRSATAASKRWLILITLLAIFAAAAIAIVFSVASWHVPGAARKLKNPVPPTQEAVDSGMFNYMNHCKSCHGENGDGNGPRAANLSVKPTNFTDANMMGEHTDGELFYQITHGRSPMPPFDGKLTDKERWELVDYLRSLAKSSSVQ
jgi:mono/diheme cytochrome c family protein